MEKVTQRQSLGGQRAKEAKREKTDGDRFCFVCSLKTNWALGEVPGSAGKLAWKPRAIQKRGGLH